VPKNVVERLRRAFLFRPDDPQNMAQQLPQKEVGREVDRIQGFRYPAPGSRVVGVSPTRESDDKVYDVNFYSRDNRNVPTQEAIYYNAKTKPTLVDSKIAHEGSPGSKNPAVLAYDPSGLRSSMTATWSELDKAIKENATPDHLPQPSWYKNRESVIAEREAKGLPAAVGKRYAYHVPEGYNKVNW
jgi:hypothetical protein